jgi:hypothetical protein
LRLGQLGASLDKNCPLIKGTCGFLKSDNQAKHFGVIPHNARRKRKRPFPDLFDKPTPPFVTDEYSFGWPRLNHFRTGFVSGVIYGRRPDVATKPPAPLVPEMADPESS